MKIGMHQSFGTLAEFPNGDIKIEILAKSGFSGGLGEW